LVIDLPRSSSTSSLDNIITNESVSVIQFSESFTYKNDFTISPSVWLGTSAGSVIVVNLNIIFEPRNISVVPSGTVFRLSGRILHISFLDQKGAMIPSPSEKWDTRKSKANRMTDGIQDLNASSGLPSSGMSSPATSTPPSTSIQFVVFCSSKEARVISLPSHVCISKQKIFDSLGSSASNITRASVVKIAGSPCLTCYLSAGRILVYSLPSLRELYTTNLDPVIDSIRSMIGLTFTFTNRGHGLYMCSPTEIQKITISSDVKEQINEMLCELYSPSVSMPEAPKQNFFAKLFASNAMIDPDQLFGEAAGKAPAGVIKREDVNVNMDQLRGRANTANNAIHDTRMKLIERGQKLNTIEIASKQMADRAEEFSTLSHKVMLKQKEKAEWSWPFTSKK
jgi:syntaxin-binding protein 5